MGRRNKKKVSKCPAAQEKSKEPVNQASQKKLEVLDLDTKSWVDAITHHFMVGATGLNTDSPSCCRTLHVKNPELRPNAEDVKKLSAGELEKLLDKNWVQWINCGEHVVSHPITPEDAPKEFTFVQPVKLFRMVKEEDLDKRDDVIEGVTNLVSDYGMQGSAVGFKCFGYGIPTIHYLTEGARFWIFIKPEGNAKFEQMVSEYLKENSNKSGCLGPRSILFSPASLRKHGIPYNIDIQMPTYSILLYPGIYYSYIDLLDRTKSAVTHFATKRWYEWAKNWEKDRCHCKEVEVVWSTQSQRKLRPRPRSYELDFCKIDDWIATHVQENGAEANSSKTLSESQSEDVTS